MRICAANGGAGAYDRPRLSTRLGALVLPAVGQIRALAAGPLPYRAGPSCLQFDAPLAFIAFRRSAGLVRARSACSNRGSGEGVRVS
jgi:hypothetical protein